MTRYDTRSLYRSASERTPNRHYRLGRALSSFPLLMNTCILRDVCLFTIERQSPREIYRCLRSGSSRRAHTLPPMNTTAVTRNQTIICSVTAWLLLHIIWSVQYVNKRAISFHIDVIQETRERLCQPNPYLSLIFLIQIS